MNPRTYNALRRIFALSLAAAALFLLAAIIIMGTVVGFHLDPAAFY